MFALTLLAFRIIRGELYQIRKGEGLIMKMLLKDHRRGDDTKMLMTIVALKMIYLIDVIVGLNVVDFYEGLQTGANSFGIVSKFWSDVQWSKDEVVLCELVCSQLFGCPFVRLSKLSTYIFWHNSSLLKYHEKGKMKKKPCKEVRHDE